MNRKRFITIVASLSVFCMSVAGTGAVWATDSGSEKFDPQPVSSDWEQKDMKGTYAYFVSVFISMMQMMIRHCLRRQVTSMQLVTRRLILLAVTSMW